MSLAVLAGGAAALADGAEVDKSPKAILADLQRDLGKVKSYHVVVSTKAKGASTRVSGEVLASGSADIAVRDRKGSVRMIILPRAVYMKADANYWRSTGGSSGEAIARKLANRWVKVPASVGAEVKPLVTKLSPKHLASCVAISTGTLSNNGLRTIGGRQVIELEDKGDRPGTSPGMLYVAAHGRVLPLRETQTGPRRAGGKRDKRCEEAGDQTSGAEITFSRFDAISRIAAPRGALSLEGSGTEA